MLTQERLKSQLSYDPASGEFVWISKRKGVKSGSKAGRISVYGYLEIGIDRKLYRAHRLAFLYMLGRWPLNEVDHINRKKDDNRWDNLRECSHRQNSLNTSKSSNKSGHRGVSWDKQRQKWLAQIRVAGKKRNLGRYDTKQEAIAAWDSAVASCSDEGFFRCQS